jgi:hypothetical protein
VIRPCGAVKKRKPLERDDLSSNRQPTLVYCLSMIFSENRFPLFRIMLWRHPAFRPMCFAVTIGKW